jgi:hypothetical protein
MVPLPLQQITQEQYAAIGRFIVEFSGFEGSIKLAIAMLAPLPDDSSTELLAGYDFAMACTVLKTLGNKRMEPDDAKRLNGHLSQALGLNTERVRVAHGTWQTVGKFHARHVSRQKLKQTEHFRDPAELIALAEEADNLGLLIFSVCYEYFPAT